MKTIVQLFVVLVLFALALPANAQGGESTLTASVIFDAVYLRLGPGPEYPVAAQAARDDMLTLDGRSADGAWYRVALPDGSSAWLASYLVTVNGDPSTLPVAGPPAPADLALRVPPGCEYFNIGPFRGSAGQPIYLVQGWEAATRELVQEYLNNVLQVVTFDGRMISTYTAYASEITFNQTRGTWQIFWEFRMGPVSAGQHRIEWTQLFNRAITDGLDNNGDGQPDTYGPEATTYGCTLIVQ